MQFEALEAEALKLSGEERARLADRLIASLSEDAEIEEAWAAEVERRIAEIEAGRAKMIPAAVAISRARDTRESNRVITDATDLTADDIAHRRVLCPAGADHVFQMWPEGWDAHATLRCTGLSASTEAGRKAEFKTRFRHLFR